MTLPGVTGFPFRVGATSLTYPSLDSLESIRLTAELFDCIELTLDYAHNNLPMTGDYLGALLALKETHNLEYTIHLPLSIQLSALNVHMVDATLKTLEEVFGVSERLIPLHYVLHVGPIPPVGRSPLGSYFDVIQRARHRRAASYGLDRVAALIDPSRVCVENLWDHFDELAPMIYEKGFSICCDVGHLMLDKEDPLNFYQQHYARIKVIHLHDIVNGSDHQQLGEADSRFRFRDFLRLLKCSGFSHTIILEQFREEHLRQSVDFLAANWQAIRNEQLASE